jgi:ribosomal protein S18 acetylase RimI-like enzyme
MSNNKIVTKEEKPIFRLIEKRDLKNTMKLMAEIRPNISGTHSCLLYNTICTDALFDKKIVFIVTEYKLDIIGFYFVVLDRDRWRTSFIFRHPFIGFIILLNRIFNELKNVFKIHNNNLQCDLVYIHEIKGLVKPEIVNRSWNDSSPQIAKLLYVAVNKTYRGGKIAHKMWKYALEVLKERGISRIDTQILLDNISSIKLHYGLGFDIYIKGHSLFATRDLNN